jgi:hypothetical protein
VAEEKGERKKISAKDSCSYLFKYIFKKLLISAKRKEKAPQIKDFFAA